MENVKKQIVSEVKVSYHPKVKPSDRIVIKDSREAYQVFLDNWNKDTIYLVEQFYVMLLNRGNRVMGIYLLSTGGITGTVADPRIILVTALNGLATSIILAHNHPSGNLQPSQADIDLTQKIKNGGKYIDIAVVDSLIITPESYYSFADNGLM
jgi:DNA repair protein RadC